MKLNYIHELLTTIHAAILCGFALILLSKYGENLLACGVGGPNSDIWTETVTLYSIIPLHSEAYRKKVYLLCWKFLYF
jgi:hypothetical protein